MPPSSQPDHPSANVPLSYKYQRLREHLRQAILSGELAGRLPGERELARRYGANAKTVNKALCDLTLEGLLVRYVGRGTFTANLESPAQAAARPRTFAWLMADHMDRGDGQQCYGRAMEALGGRGHRLVKVAVPDSLAAQVPERLLRPGQLRELSGAILFSVRPSDPFLANLHRRHLPAILANNRHDTIRIPSVQADFAHAAFELTQHLIQLGHRDIQLVIDARLLPAAADAGPGYRTALRRYDLQAAVREPACLAERLDGSGVLEGPRPPTALICVGADLAAQAAAQAARAGLAVPRQLSLAVILEPGGPPANPQMTACEFPADRIVDRAIELLLAASAGQPPQVVIVPGRLQIRGSTAPPPAGAPHPLTPPGEASV